MREEKISGTVVNGITCPSLEELQSRSCSLEELQAAVVQLALVVNKNAAMVVRENNERAVARVQDMVFTL